MKKVLLHICCGVCAFGCIEKLKANDFYVEGFFFNPNIHPYQEYEKRKDVLKIVSEIYQINIREGEYVPTLWYNLCEAYKDEPEGGIRCKICYKIRLQETFKLCQTLKFDYFTTTLTISPHKNSRVIFDIGRNISENHFLQIDFKKDNGFKRTQELSHRYKVYHQNYCGCIYSKR
ncbi:MAG: epoxyqueuosine reductase QueH [Candidatus Omnitrophica bacterium]|nr:epoxyqueuosine reductase QueH [Candidatus Omnitrophota bacterium]MCM8827165.1 epoxyqueuosine reductase QueH [Candidatus Omnitrophota bacterium]